MCDKKNKGIAIPSAIVLMAFVICFSLLLLTLVIINNLSTKYQTILLEKQIAVAKMQKDFITDGVIDGEYNLYCQVIVNEGNVNQKALIVKKSNTASATNLYYLCIYDFEQNKILANQTENFDISKKVVENIEYYYLADLIKYCQA